MVSLLRTIRLDASDTILFSPAAEPGEWAVTGGFLFHGRPFDSLSRKERVAYRSAFLGIDSFGFSTLAVVTRVSALDYESAKLALARGFVTHLGAPDLATALAAASEELAFAAELCQNHDEGQLIALHREEDEAGQLRERFRALRPRAGSVWDKPELQGHDRPFQFIQSDAPDDAEPPVEEAFDLFDTIRAEGERKE